jgi:hypothetical protein
MHGDVQYATVVPAILDPDVLSMQQANISLQKMPYPLPDQSMTKIAKLGSVNFVGYGSIAVSSVGFPSRDPRYG